MGELFGLPWVRRFPDRMKRRQQERRKHSPWATFKSREIDTVLSRACSKTYYPVQAMLKHQISAVTSTVIFSRPWGAVKKRVKSLVTGYTSHIWCIIGLVTWPSHRSRLHLSFTVHYENRSLSLPHAVQIKSQNGFLLLSLQGFRRLHFKAPAMVLSSLTTPPTLTMAGLIPPASTIACIPTTSPTWQFDI